MDNNLEHHVTDSGEPVGWRYKINDQISVWCGEISRRMFEEELDLDQREAAGDSDGGWFIVLYDDSKPRNEQSEILARVLDESSGQRLAQIIVAGLMPPRLRVISGE